MRVVDGKVSAPSVQGSEEPHPLGADKPLARSQFDHRLRATVEQRSVTIALVGAHHPPQRLRHGKRDQVILHWQQLSHSFGQPQLRLVILAVGAMSIATASPVPLLVRAMVTLLDEMSQLAGSATSGQREHPPVFVWHFAAERFQVLTCMLPQCFCDGRHDELAREPFKQLGSRFAVGNTIQLLASVYIGIVSQVQIDQCRLQIGVA